MVDGPAAKAARPLRSLATDPQLLTAGEKSPVTGDCHAGIRGSRELRRSRRPDQAWLSADFLRRRRNWWRNAPPASTPIGPAARPRVAAETFVVLMPDNVAAPLAAAAAASIAASAAIMM